MHNVKLKIIWIQTRRICIQSLEITNLKRSATVEHFALLVFLERKKVNYA
jgi:hypothetical protein